MIIVGNGVDIVENSRIKKSIKNIKFIKRIYSSEEVKKSKLKTDKVSYFAKRFAAKEAFVKALGTGFRKGINFSDISVVNDKVGKPLIKINFLSSTNLLVPEYQIELLNKSKKIIKKFEYLKKFNNDKKSVIQNKTELVKKSENKKIKEKKIKKKSKTPRTLWVRKKAS